MARASSSSGEEKGRRREPALSEREFERWAGGSSNEEEADIFGASGWCGGFGTFER